MSAYRISAEPMSEGVLLRLSFADPAEGGTVARDAAAALEALSLKGGRLARLNGPASLPVAVMLGHKLAHLYGAVAVFDPKLQGYIVAISHDPVWRVGDLID